MGRDPGRRPRPAGARPRWCARSRRSRATTDRSSSSRAPRAARASVPGEPHVTVALCATAIVVVALLWEVIAARARAPPRARAAPAARRARARRRSPRYDPGRERRAEQRARELLKSCVNEEEWAMYRDLGFIRVWGGQSRGPARRPGATSSGVPYAYLIYPHKPIVAYLPQTGRLLNEYCVEFPDESKPYGSRPAAGLRRRAGQVDGAQGRRAAADLRGQHAPARAARSTRARSSATSGASAAGSASASSAARRGTRRRRRASVDSAAMSAAGNGQLRPQAPLPRAHRGA